MSERSEIDQLQTELVEKARELGFASIGFADAHDDPRMAERLTPQQLRKLERVAPEEGEGRLPRNAGEALARIRRVDDPEAVEMTVRAAAACTFGGIFDKL